MANWRHPCNQGQTWKPRVQSGHWHFNSFTRWQLNIITKPWWETNQNQTTSFFPHIPSQKKLRLVCLHEHGNPILVHHHDKNNSINHIGTQKHRMWPRSKSGFPHQFDMVKKQYSWRKCSLQDEIQQQTQCPSIETENDIYRRVSLIQTVTTIVCLILTTTWINGWDSAKRSIWKTK